MRSVLQTLTIIAVLIGVPIALGSQSPGIGTFSRLIFRDSSVNGPHIRWGNGSPDGSVTAPRGSLYLRTGDGTAWVNTDGASAWTSASGGNPFDQNLNTTDDVQFDELTVTSCTGCGGGGGDVQVGITIDGAGDVITTGVKGFISVPISGTITAATLLSTDASATAGDLVIDVWLDSYANYPPTNADSITASAPPTLSSANKSQDTTLTGWTTAVSAGAVLGFNVDSAATVTRATLVITVTP